MEDVFLSAWISEVKLFVVVQGQPVCIISMTTLKPVNGISAVLFLFF